MAWFARRTTARQSARVMARTNARAQMRVQRRWGMMGSTGEEQRARTTKSGSDSTRRARTRRPVGNLKAKVSKGRNNTRTV